MKSKITFIHVLSPLHAGTGQGVGVIDLPIAREKATNIPYLPGSSVKGTIRDEFNGDPNQDKIFGPEDASFAGAIQFTDQTLLCLPVRSLAGTFAYVTSPYILKRLKRDANLNYAVPKPADDKKCIVAGNTLKIDQSRNDICLEDLDLEVEHTDTNWAGWIKDKVFTDPVWQGHFVERFCIVSDNVFSFLLNTATQVTARIKLDDDTKTTQQGALWTEESLPTESILFGLALAFPNASTFRNEIQIFTDVSNKIGKPLQFGGSATVGRGLCQVRMADNPATLSATDSGGEEE
jgi:CRISPR-associated protein Cmr4